jgi:hypothetical protein
MKSVEVYFIKCPCGALVIPIGVAIVDFIKRPSHLEIRNSQ